MYQGQNPDGKNTKLFDSAMKSASLIHKNVKILTYKPLGPCYTVGIYFIDKVVVIKHMSFPVTKFIILPSVVIEAESQVWCCLYKLTRKMSQDFPGFNWIPWF